MSHQLIFLAGFGAGCLVSLLLLLTYALCRMAALGDAQRVIHEEPPVLNFPRKPYDWQASDVFEEEAA